MAGCRQVAYEVVNNFMSSHHKKQGDDQMRNAFYNSEWRLVNDGFINCYGFYKRFKIQISNYILFIHVE